MAAEARSWWRGPSLTTGWGLLAWLTVPVTAVSTIGPIREVDVYWHIRMGADILANGRFGGDPAWTYGPADTTWVTTQSAAELLLYAIHALASWPGIMMFRVLMAAAAMASVILACTYVVRTRSAVSVARGAALVALPAAVVLNEFAQERPQSLSLVLLPWVGLLLLRVMYADSWPRWWIVGIVVMVWSWFHGAAVIVGPVLVVGALIHSLGVGGLRWVPVLARSVRRGWAVVVAAVVAPLLGPAGVNYYAQAQRISDAATGRLIEWSPMTANSAYLWAALILVAMWGMALVHLAARSGAVWRTMRMDVLLIVPAILVMTTAGRYLGLGYLILAPLVARRITQAWDRPAPARLRRGVAVAVLGTVSVLAAGISVAAAVGVRPVDSHQPLRVWEAMSRLDDDRRVFVDYVLGGQAGQLGDVVVSIDGRSDRYGGELIDANRSFLGGSPDWRDILDRYPGTTDAVVPTGSAVIALLEDAGWSVACTDAGYTWLTAPGRTGGCPEE